MFGLIVFNVVAALVSGIFLWIAMQPTAPSKSWSDCD